MNKLIHSFYGCKCSEHWMFLQSCYFCLSSIYANQSGFDIDLYTNYDFGQLLDKAPYKNIYNIFENHKEYAKIDSKVWAWPKFVALDMVPRDTIHIDGDVFLKDNSCKELLDFDGCDVVLQHLEHVNHFGDMKAIYDESYESVKHLKWPDYIENKYLSHMPNNGVLGVNNDSLWVRYRDTYWDMCNQCIPGMFDGNNITVPDIIFEQYFLKEMCDKFNYSIKYILPGEDWDDINEYAIEHKYQHVCCEKRKYLNKVISIIKRKDPICYESLKSNWGNKYPEYFEI